MKRYEVLVTREAAGDLEEIHKFLSIQRSPAAADAMLDELLSLAETLTRFPERGSIPREIEGTGIRQWRQLIFSSYRVIYRVIDKRVFISVIVDGRRELKMLLERRLVRPP